MTSRLETQIFAIQEERTKEHARMERAFEKYGNQSEIEKYRVELDSISKSMRKLAEQTATLRKELTAAGKDELASIVFDLQKQEEELLLIRFALFNFYAGEYSYFIVNKSPYFKFVKKI